MVLPVVGSAVYFLHDQSEKSDKIKSELIKQACVQLGYTFSLLSSFTQQHRDSRNASEILNHLFPAYHQKDSARLIPDIYAY